MAERVEKQNEISLNGTRMRLKGNVQSSLISRYAPKIATGETTSESMQGRSSVQWHDNRGGIGVERISDVDVARNINLNRSWYSNAWLRHDGHLTLAPLATTTAVSGVSGTITVGAIGEFGDAIFAAFSTSVREYNLIADTWTAKHTLPAAATDTVTGPLGGTTYIFMAHTGGYSYSSAPTDGTSAWTDDTTDTKYMAFWDERLWGISSAGQLWFSTAIGVETNDALLPLPTGYVTDLFVDRDASGEPILYAATKVGLFAHDLSNSRFVKTELDLPFLDEAGLGVKRWRGATYYPAGLSIYRYQPGPTALVDVVGPDRDDGLPSDRKGKIIRLESSHNQLIALVDSTSTAATEFQDFLGYSVHTDQVIDAEVGVSTILGWDTRGWQVLWESENNTEAITYAHVSNTHDGYRLWWGHNRRVHYMALPVDIVNPGQTADFEYASSFTHEYPHLVISEETEGLALRLRIQCQNMSSTETLTPGYAVNFETDFKDFTAVTSDGITTYDFPDDDDAPATGKEIRAIQIRVKGARNSADTFASPDLIATNFEWRKKLPAQYAWRCTVDLSTEYGGRSVKELRAALITAAASNALVEFTFRNDTGNSRNYYVDVVEIVGLEETGVNERGDVQLVLAQV